MKEPTVNKKLLIIDPDEVARRIISRRLSVAGYEISTAVDGQSAMAEIKEKSPDVIITELTLPKLSGIQLCVETRKNPETKNIPIIILSHKGMLHDRIAALDSGASDYITKPFSLSELEARLRAALRKQED